MRAKIYISRGNPTVLTKSADIIKRYNKKSMQENRAGLLYSLYGDTYITSYYYSGEFRVFSHVTLLNSKPLVRDSEKSTGHSTR